MVTKSELASLTPGRGPLSLGHGPWAPGPGPRKRETEEMRWEEGAGSSCKTVDSALVDAESHRSSRGPRSERCHKSMERRGGRQEVEVVWPHRQKFVVGPQTCCRGRRQQGGGDQEVHALGGAMASSAQWRTKAVIGHGGCRPGSRGVASTQSRRPASTAAGGGGSGGDDSR